jgi:hypothetical protein
MPGHPVVYDIAAGAYVVTYTDTSDPNAGTKTLRLGAHALTAPDVSFQFTGDVNHRYRYVYAVVNGVHARQAIGKITLHLPVTAETTQLPHQSWTGDRMATDSKDSLGSRNRPLSQGSWTPKNQQVVGAGSRVDNLFSYRT